MYCLYFLRPFLNYLNSLWYIVACFMQSETYQNEAKSFISSEAQPGTLPLQQAGSRILPALLASPDLLYL